MTPDLDPNSYAKILQIFLQPYFAKIQAKLNPLQPYFAKIKVKVKSQVKVQSKVKIQSPK